MSHGLHVTLNLNNYAKLTKIKLLDSRLLDIMINRLVRQLVEDHDEFQDTVLLGLQPKGVYLAERIREGITRTTDCDVPLGYLDATFHRDDFKSAGTTQPNETKVPFLLEDKRVILVDDVLYTGRTVRAALDAMMDFGRPSQVKFLILVDRKYSRDVPIQADYIGKSVNTIQSQRVVVEWKEQGHAEDCIWLAKDWK